MAFHFGITTGYMAKAHEKSCFIEKMDEACALGNFTHFFCGFVHRLAGTNSGCSFMRLVFIMYIMYNVSTKKWSFLVMGRWQHGDRYG